MLSGVAAPGMARQQIIYNNGIPYRRTANGWQVYQPAAARRNQAIRRNQAAQANNNRARNAAAARTNQGGGAGTRKAAAQPAAPINMGTEVQSLRDRHAAIAGTLPSDIKRLDSEAQPVVSKLPDVAQFGYYSTMEDYKTLSTGDQARVKGALQQLTGVAEDDRAKFIDSASKPFDAIQHDEQQLQAARKQPHVLFFQLRDEVTKFSRAAAAPAPAPAATPAAATPSPAPAAGGGDVSGGVKPATPKKRKPKANTQ